MRLSIEAGKAREISFVLKDEYNNPIDLTGLTGTFEAFLSVPGQDSSATISEPITVMSAINGECKVLIDDSASDVTPAVYYYYVSFAYGTGDNRVLDKGTLNVIGDDADRINNIKQKYGFTYSYYQIKSALDYARTQTKTNSFNKEEGYGMRTDGNNVITVCNYIMDVDNDGSVTAADIEIKQVLESYPYTVTDLSSHISNIVLEHPTGKSFIVMDGKYPEEGFKLNLIYYRARKPYIESLPIIDRIEDFYVIYYLFSTLEINKLQRGMTSRSINGVEITFNKESIDSFLITLRNWIANENLKLKPSNTCLNRTKNSLFRSVQINKGY